MVQRKAVRGVDPLAAIRVYEDDDILVVNKPRGMLTASGPRDKRPTLWGTVQAYGDRLRTQVGIIHRLDRDASGLLVFSKNDNAYQSLKTQFFRHTVDRMYMAIVQGKPRSKAGRIHNRLSEWKDGTVHTTSRGDKGEEAISDFEVIGHEKNFALVRVKLETGRKHQIRVHMATLGSPIAGDDVYNPKSKGEGLMLVAIRLCFDHPRTGKRMEFEVDLPPHMRDFIRHLREPKKP